MKKNNVSQEQLIVSLASRGDPTAFYSLVVPHFEKKYFHLRSGGSSHEDTSEKIISEACTLFDKIRGTMPADFNEWFDSHSESVTAADEAAEFSLERQIATDYSRFIRDLQLNLMRKVSKMNKKRRFNLLFTLKKYRPSPSVSIFLLVIAVLISSSIIYLHLTKSYVCILFNNTQNEYSFTIPFKAKTIHDSLQNAKQNAENLKTDASKNLPDTSKKTTQATQIDTSHHPTQPPPPVVKKAVIRPKKMESEQVSIPTPASPISGTVEQAPDHEPKAGQENNSTITETPAPEIKTGTYNEP